jgi:hypothetical protein
MTEKTFNSEQVKNGKNMLQSSAPGAAQLIPQNMLLSEDALYDPAPTEIVRRQTMLEALQYLQWRHGYEGRSGEFEVSGLLPVRVYLPSENKQSEQKIIAAINQMAAAFGLEIAFEFREVRGSWFKTWIMRVRRTMSTPEVAERLRKLERAVELKALHLPQAQVDEKQAHAVAELLRAVGSTPNAVIQVGPLLIVKQPSANGGAISVRTLTPEDMIKFETDPTLIASSGYLPEITDHIPQEEKDKSRKEKIPVRGRKAKPGEIDPRQ